DELITRTRTLNADRHTDDLAVLRLDWNTGTAGPTAKTSRTAP
ncbi:fused response regulator/phosphatase, partial [Streptomyces sp. NPDC003631]